MELQKMTSRTFWTRMSKTSRAEMAKYIARTLLLPRRTVESIALLIDGRIRTLYMYFVFIKSIYKK